MSDKVVATIVSVTPSQVNTKRGPAVKHTIMTAAGAELQTFKADLAQTAQSLIGQAVEIEYDVSVNGEWTNYYPLSILPVANPALQAQMVQATLGSQSPGAQFAGQMAQTAAPLPGSVPNTLGGQGHPPLQTGDYFADPKTVSIHRQVAAKVAAAMVTEQSTPTEFWANVEALVVYFNSGATPLDIAKVSGGGEFDEGIPFQPTI